MSKTRFNVVELIRKKRDGKVLDAPEISFLIEAYTAGDIPDYQISAFMMAAFLKGLNSDESAALTRAMLHSGEVLDLSHIPGIKVDKHSTGGVGDKLSLILAPVVAAAGVPVPMISGRGLGHTGGTLDKLESIPGFNVNQNLQRYREILKKHNLVLIGQTAEIAPADKKLYSLRDVTATVEYIPFIAGSIMSKKIAEGIDALVLDVKYGSGAFMKTPEQARELAKALVDIGEQFGKRTIAFLTNMEQPLGRAIGNWLEVKECLDSLHGNGPKDVVDLSNLLSGTMLMLGGKTRTIFEGIECSREMIRNGSAFQKFVDIAREQGGDASVLIDPGTYPCNADIFELTASKTGVVCAMETFELGMASLELGAGRRTKEETIDPAAGIILHKKIGDKVLENETLATLYTNKAEVVEQVKSRITSAISIGAAASTPPKQVLECITRDGVEPFEL